MIPRDSGRYTWLDGVEKRYFRLPQCASPPEEVAFMDRVLAMLSPDERKERGWAKANEEKEEEEKVVLVVEDE